MKTELTLQQSILDTFAFFLLFESVLTVEETQYYLWNNRTIAPKDLQQELDNLVQQKKLTYHRGLYAIKRENIKKRIYRTVELEKKLRIATRAAKKLRYIPFLEAVFVCNSIALETVSENSDIDFFIITKKNKIWITRLLSTSLLRFCRIARTKRNTVDKVCLSFYASEDALDFSDLTIAAPDIYFCYWLRTLLPLYDPKEMITTIYKKNQWLNQYFSTMRYTKKTSKRIAVIDTVVSSRIKKILELFWKGHVGELIERQAKEIQQVKMKFRYNSVRNEPDTRVVISDTILKFHETDRRKEYQENWKKNKVTI